MAAARGMVPKQVAEFVAGVCGDETILVLGLDGGSYRELGRYQRGEHTHSGSLAGLRVDVAAAFDAPKAAV